MPGALKSNASLAKGCSEEAGGKEGRREGGRGGRGGGEDGRIAPATTPSPRVRGAGARYKVS